MKHAPSILIVEDDHLTLQTLSYLLGKRGFKVNGLTDGRQLFDSPEIASADAFLIDMNLPFTDGTELLKEVKNRFPEKKVVLTTANNSLSHYENSGADFLLSKPYNLASINVLEEFLNPN